VGARLRWAARFSRMVASRWLAVELAAGLVSLCIVIVGVGASGEEQEHLSALFFECGENIVPWDERDVAFEVRGIFSGLRAEVGSSG